MSEEEREEAFDLLDGLTPPEQRTLMRALAQIRDGQDIEDVMAQLVRAQSVAMELTERLEKVLNRLLEAQSMLCGLETIRHSAGSDPQAIIRMGNGTCAPVSIHPEVDLEELRGLKSWEVALVAQKELMVVGYWKDDDYLWRRAQGEIVEFKEYYQARRDMAWIEPKGRPEDIVTLEPPLCDRNLSPGDSLVLQRDAPNHAIAFVSREHAQPEYEIPREQLDSTLDDLAGLDAIAERFLEKVLVRAVFPELRDKFALDPLRGMILESKKPGQGKTALVRAMGCDMHSLGDKKGFDFCLWSIEPNELKNKFHGEDARRVRQLGAAIRARCARQDPSRRLVIWVYFDECDSLGGRSNSELGVTSAAQNDIVQSLLPMLDGLRKDASKNENRFVVVFLGLTNRLDIVDIALRRPGRMGDLIISMPEYTIEDAESILYKYARKASIPFHLGDREVSNVDEGVVRRRILQPVLAPVYDAPVLYYTTEDHERRRIEVTAGRALSGASLRSAMNGAKEKAAVRELREHGVAAVSSDELTDALIEESRKAAAQLVNDHALLKRILDVKGRVLDAGLMPIEDMQEHHYLRLQAS